VKLPLCILLTLFRRYHSLPADPVANSDCTDADDFLQLQVPAIFVADERTFEQAKVYGSSDPFIL
jgi:hypothetical protein